MFVPPWPRIELGLSRNEIRMLFIWQRGSVGITVYRCMCGVFHASLQDGGTWLTKDRGRREKWRHCVWSKVVLEQTDYLLNRRREQTQFSAVLTTVYYAVDHMAFGFRPSLDLPESPRYLPADSWPLERTVLASGWRCVSLEHQAMDTVQKPCNPKKIFNIFSANINDIQGERKMYGETYRR